MLIIALDWYYLDYSVTLKPMDMELKDKFIAHPIFASLPKEYEAFAVNYNL